MIWIPMAIILLAVVFILYGKSGLKSALLLAGALLIKDAAAHFAGKLGEWLIVSLYAVVAIGIYIIRRNKKKKK
jgi:hypothetical protein